MIPHALNDTLNLLRDKIWIVKLSKFANIYIVGGSVRDAYLGNSIKDIDLIVEQLSLGEIKEMLEEYGRVNIVGESFSVLKFRPDGWKGEDFDIAVPRKDRKIGDTHKDFEVITENVSVLDDLKRRDFTINSVAVNVMTGEILDPFNGLVDLHKKVIRATDIHAFAEDPLRILRAMMFASRFNFMIVSSTKSLMSIYSKELKTISPERILEEFMKILNKGGDINTMINIMYETDIDLVLFERKMKRDRVHQKLDILSFFYVIASLGNIDPVRFYKVQLKGEYLISEGIKQLCVLMNINESSQDEELLRYIVFTSIKRSPLLLDVKIFPTRINDILELMREEVIPMKASDIQVNGDDVLNLEPSTKGEDVGRILKQIQLDALMERLNWSNRNACIRRLKEILKHMK